MYRGGPLMTTCPPLPEAGLEKSKKSNRSSNAGVFTGA